MKGLPVTRFPLTPLLLGLLGACSAAPAANKAPAAEPAPSPLGRVGDAAHPVVVELFQSQGCSSCPPAIANVNAIADRPDILALTFAVTYWDRLGWKDTFATPEQTKRQWDYANAAKRGQVFTPQVIVNGEASIVGARRSQLDQTIAAARKLTGPAITAARGAVTIAAGKATTPATVWLVSYDPRAQQVRIGRGENGGRTITHKNVVRDLVSLGSWNGKPARFALPAAKPGLKTAVLVQSDNGGAVIAARAT
jgi:hypothetical protein